MCGWLNDSISCKFPDSMDCRVLVLIPPSEVLLPLQMWRGRSLQDRSSYVVPKRAFSCFDGVTFCFNGSNNYNVYNTQLLLPELICVAPKARLGLMVSFVTPSHDPSQY